jgi:hypothetical protein
MCVPVWLSVLTYGLRFSPFYARACLTDWVIFFFFRRMPKAKKRKKKLAQNTNSERLFEKRMQQIK